MGNLNDAVLIVDQKQAATFRPEIPPHASDSRRRVSLAGERDEAVGEGGAANRRG